MTSAILAIAALCLPVAFRLFNDGTGIYFWLWALNIDTGSAEIWFNDSMIAVVGAILETAVIVVAIVILIFVTKSIKNDSNKAKKIDALLILAAILLVISPVGYIIGGDAYQHNFWAKYTPHFGLIGLFIAAGLVIITIILRKRA